MGKRKKNKHIRKRSGRPESLIEKVGHGFISDLFFKHAVVKFANSHPHPEGEEIRIKIDLKDSTGLGGIAWHGGSGFHLGNAAPLSYGMDQRFHWTSWLFCDEEKKYFIDELHNTADKKVLKYLVDNVAELKDAELFQMEKKNGTQNKKPKKCLRLYATDEFMTHMKSFNFNFVDLKYKYYDGLGRKQQIKKIGITQNRFMGGIVLLDFLSRFYASVKWIVRDLGLENQFMKSFKTFEFIKDKASLKALIKKYLTKEAENNRGFSEECAEQLAELFIKIDAKKYFSCRGSHKELIKLIDVTFFAAFTSIRKVTFIHAEGVEAGDTFEPMDHKIGCKIRDPNQCDCEDHIKEQYIKRIAWLQTYDGFSDLEICNLLCGVSPVILKRSNLSDYSLMGLNFKLANELINEFISLMTDERLIIFYAEEEDDEGCSDYAQHISCIPIWEQTGRRIIYVSQDVVSPFLKTAPPSEYFTVEQPRWGVAAYFQFEWPSEYEINAKKIKETSYQQFQSHRLPSNIGKPISKFEIDGAFVSYHPHTKLLIFKDPKKEGEANDFLKTFDYDGMVDRGEITSEEAHKEKHKTYKNFGAELKEVPAYQVSFFVKMYREDGNYTHLIQNLTLHGETDPYYTIFNSGWGEEINTKLTSLMMNILYALNRTKIIEVKSVSGKRAKSFGKLKDVIRWTEAPYTRLSMDTTYKQVIRKSYKPNPDADGEPKHRKKPHRRDPHWQRVWILGDNMADWELPDAEKVHPTSGNTHYRVSRLFQGSYINGTELDMPRRKTEVRIKKWKPKTSKESA